MGVKISDLSNASTLGGTEILPIVQQGTTSKVTLKEIANYEIVSVYTVADLSQISTWSNKIVYVKGDIDLSSGSYTIPTTVVLDMTGGTFSNGTITCTNTFVVAPRKKIFINITLSGTLRNDEIYPEWWADSSTTNWNTALQSAVNAASLTGTKVKLAARNYTISSGITIPAGVGLMGVGKGETALAAGATSGSIIQLTTSATSSYAVTITGAMCSLENLTVKGLASILGYGNGVKINGVQNNNGSAALIENVNFENVHITGFYNGKGLYLVSGNGGGIGYCMFRNLRTRNCSVHVQVETLSANPIYGNLDGNGQAYTNPGAGSSFTNSNVWDGHYGSGFANKVLYVRTELDADKLYGRDVYRPANNLIFTGIVYEPQKSSGGHIVLEGGGSQVRMHDIRVEASTQDSDYPNVPVIYLGPDTRDSLITLDQASVTTMDLGENNQIYSKNSKYAAPVNISQNLYTNAGLVGLRTTLYGTASIYSIPGWTIEEQYVGTGSQFAWRPIQTQSVVQLYYTSGSDSYLPDSTYKTLKAVVPPKYQVRIHQNIDQTAYDISTARVNWFVNTALSKSVTLTYQDGTPSSSLVSGGTTFGGNMWEPVGGMFPVYTSATASYYRIALFANNTQDEVTGSNIEFSFSKPTFVKGETTPVEAYKPITEAGGTIYAPLACNYVRGVDPTLSKYNSGSQSSTLNLPLEGNYFEIVSGSSIQRINYAFNRFPQHTSITLIFQVAGITIVNSGFISLTKPFKSEVGSTITLFSPEGNGTWIETGRYSKNTQGVSTVDYSSSLNPVSSSWLELPVDGTNIFTLTNGSGSNVSIARINNSAATRLPEGSLLLLEFAHTTGSVSITNNPYIKLNTTTAYSPSNGDWILFYIKDDGVPREIHRKPPTQPAQTKGVSSIVISSSVNYSLIQANELTLSTAGENFFNLSAASGSVTIQRINNNASNRFAGGSIINLKFTTTGSTLSTAGGYITLSGSTNFTPPTGSIIGLITQGDGTWEELYRRL